MIFYDLPGDIKLYIASYILGHSKIIKLKNNKVFRTYINRFKPTIDFENKDNVYNFCIYKFNLKSVAPSSYLKYYINDKELKYLIEKYDKIKYETTIDFYIKMNDDNENPNGVYVTGTTSCKVCKTFEELNYHINNCTSVNTFHSNNPDTLVDFKYVRYKVKISGFNETHLRKLYNRFVEVFN